MSFTVSTDLWDLCQRVGVLENASDKHNRRLNKLEGDAKMQKAMADALESSADPSKLESNKDYALDWYINQYQNMCKEYNKVKIELDGKQSTLEMYIDQNHKFFDQIKELENKLDDKQKVLEMVMDQRSRYVKQLMDAEKKVKEFEENIHNLTKKNQMHRGTIKNHEDRILELEKEVEYHKAFAGSEKIKKLELVIKYLEDKNRFLSDLNDEYRKMVVNDEDA